MGKYLAEYVLENPGKCKLEDIEKCTEKISKKQTDATSKRPEETLKKLKSKWPCPSATYQEKFGYTLVCTMNQWTIFHKLEKQKCPSCLKLFNKKINLLTHWTLFHKNG